MQGKRNFKVSTRCTVYRGKLYSFPVQKLVNSGDEVVSHEVFKMHINMFNA